MILFFTLKQKAYTLFTGMKYCISETKDMSMEDFPPSSSFSLAIALLYCLKQKHPYLWQRGICRVSLDDMKVQEQGMQATSASAGDRDHENELEKSGRGKEKKNLFQ